MKIAASQYAAALYGATKEKSQSEIKDVISNFIKNLARNKQLKNIPKIIAKFNEIHNRENDIVEAEVITREKISENVLNYVRNYLSKKFKSEKVELKNTTDESIKGGVIIKVGDVVADASVVGNLEELRKSLSR